MPCLAREGVWIFGVPSIVPEGDWGLWSPRFHYDYLLRAEC